MVETLLTILAQLAVRPTCTRRRFLADVLARRAASGCVSGLETVLAAAVNGTWRSFIAYIGSALVVETVDAIRSSNFASQHAVPIFDPVRRTLAVAGANTFATVDYDRRVIEHSFPADTDARLGALGAEDRNDLGNQGFGSFGGLSGEILNTPSNLGSGWGSLGLRGDPAPLNGLGRGVNGPGGILGPGGYAGPNASTAANDDGYSSWEKAVGGALTAVGGAVLGAGLGPVVTGGAAAGPPGWISIVFCSLALGPT